MNPLLHVTTGRGLDRLVFRAALLRRRLAAATAVFGEPLRPERPPATSMFFCLGEPILGFLWVRRADPMAAALFRRRIDDAGDVTAAAEDEGLVLAAGELERAIGRAPGHDVIFAGADDEDRQLYLSEIDRHAAVDERARLAQPVLEIGVTQVVAVHRSRQVGAVRVPVQQIEGC